MSPIKSFISPNTDRHLNLSSLGTQGEDEVEDLPFCAFFSTGDDEGFEYEWHVLNVKNGATRSVSTKMPSVACHGPTPVVWGTRIGGFCDDDGDHVVYFDSKHPKIGCTRAAPMSVGRLHPSSVVFEGKIYVFGGTGEGDFAEVYDISQNSWTPLSAPNDDPVDISWPVLLDSSGSRILVHIFWNRSLYAYSIHDKSWECLDENYGVWSEPAVIVDGVVYSLVNPGDYICCLSPTECSLQAYDVVTKKKLTTKWLSEFEVYFSLPVDMFHLGNHKFCIVWFSEDEMLFSCIKFDVCKNTSGEICATKESESVFPFEADYCEFASI